MKISRARNGRQASALIAMLTILGIMFILFAINGKTLKRLSQHVDALNRQQTNHLATVNQ
jgi:predicted PurR-regulated permease PerM